MVSFPSGSKNSNENESCSIADLFLYSYENELSDNMISKVATGDLPGHLIYAKDTLMI